jgi:predicted metalloprotease with PDZ domain
VPDTTVIKVGTTDVLISVFSPTKKITSKFLASKLDTLLQAQGKYLGGKLPVEKYAFLIYFDSKQGYSGGEGALEHSYCSMYYYPERSPEAMSEEFVNHAAHEFFHIVTPLTIHSEEIQFFDFNQPKMSQHLWLYEGSTEYHAHMVQEKYGLITQQELLDRLGGKITNSRNNYNDTVAFTKMSANVLGPYKKQFGNVYQKGALITMCLDIKLLQLSNSKYGFLDLIHDLSNKYGKQKGFKDDELFNEIQGFTYPEIKQFLDTYVGGNQPLPLEEIFNIVGVNYQSILETKDSTFSLGKIAIGYNPKTERLMVNDTTGMNTLGRQLGYQKGDEYVSINGKELTLQNANDVINNLYSSGRVGDSLVMKMMRNNEPVELRATMTKVPMTKYNVLTFNDAATQQQLMLRDAWLKPRS